MQPLQSNFAFLAAHDPGLARLGALAEWAFHYDPPTTLGKLRLFAELLAKLVAARHAVEILPAESFEQESRTEAEARAREAEAYARETAEQKAAREAEDRAVWEALAAEQEAANVALAGQLRSIREQAEPVAPSARAALLQQSEQAAEEIELDEADTRLIIDAKLRAIGWQADTNRLRHALGIRPDPVSAIAIAEWPTDSGPVDYALFVKGRCVGVIEAKKLGTDVPAVLEHTKRYARGIKLGADEIPIESPWQHGLDASYRVPFVFATNGRPFVKQLATKSGIWFWDARLATSAATALPEWFSPQDIEEKLAQDLDADRHGLAEEPFDYAGLRPYQRDAAEAIEAALVEGRRDMLVAMATGTGKTRTCVALMYRLLKHKRFRRVLFLVDRNALGKQAEQALDNTELEGLLKFSSTFNVARLDKKSPDKEDRVQVATVQSLVRRILYPRRAGTAGPQRRAGLGIARTHPRQPRGRGQAVRPSRTRRPRIRERRLILAAQDRSRERSRRMPIRRVRLASFDL